jgi:peptidoglycan/xylan/chitin deacetylase (PgdA/CDA1 family)
MRRPLVAALLFAVCVPAGLAAVQAPSLVGGAVATPAGEHRAVARILGRGALVSCGGGHGDAVALTFDDGPGPYTERVLAVLRRFGAHATFFVVGNRLGYWPEAARDELLAGGVGNHTWSHPDLTRLSPWLVWLELMRTQYAIGAAAGSRPVLFRTPYAAHSPATDAIVRKLGLLEIFWDVDSRDDTPSPRVSDIVRNVQDGLRPGAIVLMHDIHPWTLAALPRVLQAIRDRGLRAVSVPELLALDPPAPGQRCPYGPVGAGD